MASIQLGKLDDDEEVDRAMQKPQSLGSEPNHVMFLCALSLRFTKKKFQQLSRKRNMVCSEHEQIWCWWFYWGHHWKTSDFWFPSQQQSGGHNSWRVGLQHSTFAKNCLCECLSEVTGLFQQEDFCLSTKLSVTETFEKNWSVVERCQNAKVSVWLFARSFGWWLQALSVIRHQ